MRISTDILALALLAVLAYFPLFLNLDTQPLHLWDESFTAVQAIEFQDSGNWLVPTSNHEPDRIHVRPPLAAWLSALLIPIVGPNELAVRLPSALAGLSAVFLVFGIGLWGFGSLAAGFGRALVLLTSAGFVGYHGIRNGDSDALLALWTTLACWAFIRFLQEKKPDRHLILLGMSLFLVVMTKSTQGLMILPGMAIGCVFAGKLGYVLRSWKFWLTAGLTLFFTCGYYLLRNYFDPGYLDAVLQTEVFSRFSDAFGGHEAPPYHYLEQGLNSRFLPWAWLMPLLLLLVAYHLHKGTQRVALLVFLGAASVYLLLISVAATKVEWYDLPIYPPLAILMGLTLFEPVYTHFKADRKYWGILALAACMVFPYSFSVKRAYDAHEPLHWFSVHYPRYLELVQQDHPEWKEVHILYGHFNPALLFYREAFKEHDPPLQLDLHSTSADQAKQLNWKTGDLLVAAEADLIDATGERWQLEQVHEWASGWAHVHPFRTWRVIEQKP